MPDLQKYLIKNFISGFIYGPKFWKSYNLINSNDYEINNGGTTPLHLAAHRTNDVMIDILTKQGADVNAQDKHGYTPLHKAYYNSSTGSIDLLISNGADKKIKDNYGNRIFYF